MKPPSPITLCVSTIIDGRHYVAGDPLPYGSVADIPAFLRRYVDTGEPDVPLPARRRQLNYKTNEPYDVDDEGHLLSRRGAQAAAGMQAAEQEREFIEQD